LPLLGSSQKSNERFKLLGGDLFFEEHVGDPQGVEEFQELLEVDVGCLIKVAFQKKGILGATKKKEIAISCGLTELGLARLSVLMEDAIVTGVVQAGGIEGPHKGNDEINDALGQGILL